MPHTPSFFSFSQVLLLYTFYQLLGEDPPPYPALLSEVTVKAQSIYCMHSKQLSYLFHISLKVKNCIDNFHSPSRQLFRINLVRKCEVVQYDVNHHKFTLNSLIRRAYFFLIFRQNINIPFYPKNNLTFIIFLTVNEQNIMK